MVKLPLFPILTLLITSVFASSALGGYVQPQKLPITEAVPKAISQNGNVKPIEIPQPTNFNIGGSKISAPAGETVSVKQGTASFSYIDSATTKSGGAIESGSSVTLAKNGDLTAKSAGSYQTPFITIEGATGLRVSGDGAKVSFASAKRMEAGGFKFPNVGATSIASKPRGPVQTIDSVLSLSASKTPLVQENPLPVRFEDASISITPGRTRTPTRFDVSRLSGTNPGSSLGITQQGGGIIIGKSLSITPIDFSKPMQIQSTIYEPNKLQIDIANAYLRQKANVPKNMGPAIHEFEARNKISVFFRPGILVNEKYVS